MSTTGLVLGRFAPLHAGHRAVIERARAETDRVIVLVFDAPEVTDVPLPVRAGWIRALYPDADVREAWDGPTETGDAPEIEAMHDAYLARVLAGARVTHVFASEPYGAHVARRLGAADVRVDEARRAVPVSGTMIRRDPWGHRQWLDPVVYRDLVLRVAFVGAPSTGKSTICEALARAHSTAWMPEYGRDYWIEHQVNRRLTPAQLVELAEGHREREDAAVLAARDVLFVDTEALVTRLYAQWYHGAALPRLEQLADESVQRYDVFFLCGDEIPYEEEWARSGEVFRSTFQRMLQADLVRRRLPFVTLRGDLATRMATVDAVLRGYRKWTSFGDHLRRQGTGD